MTTPADLSPSRSLDPGGVAKTLKPAVETIADKDTKKKAQKLLERLNESLKQLDKDLDSDVLVKLDPKSKLSSVAAAKQLLAKIDSEKVKDLGKTIGDRYGDLKEYAEELRGLLGKDRAVADALKLLAAMVVDGHAWTLSCERYISRGIAWVGKEQARLAELEGGSAGLSTESARMVAKTRTALKMVRAGGGEVTYQFLAADCKTDLFIYVAGDATGGGAEERVRNALGDLGKGATMIRGECGLLDRKVFFASPKLSGGTYAVRFQKRLQQDLGQRLPIAVGTDKKALETVDSDDFDDPLDYLIAQRGPLASRAKTCKSRREAVLKLLKQEKVLDAGGVTARQAENLLERADAAASSSDLSDFERAMGEIQQLVNGFKELQKRALSDEIAFRAEARRLTPDLAALRKDVMLRIDEVEQAVKDGVLLEREKVAAQARRVKLREASKEFDAIYDRIDRAKKDAWAEDLFSEGTASITSLRSLIDDMAEEVRKERSDEAEARRRKEKEEKRAAGAKSKEDAK